MSPRETHLYIRGTRRPPRGTRRPPGARRHADDGAGSVLAVAILGALVVVAMSVLLLGAGLGARQRIVAAADAAALAAADAASGAVAGAPCDRAAEVADANGAGLASCGLDGLIATVEVTGGFGPFPLAARSTAGPPSGEPT